MVMSTTDWIAIAIVTILVFIFLVVVFAASGPPAPKPDPFPPIEPFTEERILGQIGDTSPVTQNIPDGYVPIIVTLASPIVASVDLQPAEKSLRGVRETKTQIMTTKNTGKGLLKLTGAGPDQLMATQNPVLAINYNVAFPPTSKTENVSYEGSDKKTSGSSANTFPVENARSSVRDILFSSRAEEDKAVPGTLLVFYDSNYSDTNKTINLVVYDNKIAYDIAWTLIGGSDETIVLEVDFEANGTIAVSEEIYSS